MKRIVSIIIMVCVIFSLSTVVFAHTDKVTVTIYGVEVKFPDAQPFVDDRDRTLVPIRFVSEVMNSIVSWDGDTKTVIIKKDGDTIKYTIGQLMAYLNDEMVVFDSFGILKENRTYVPLRFISEMLCCEVIWDNNTNTVKITTSDKIKKFPEPKIKVNYPSSESDKRLFWITLENYREFRRDCPYYEFKIDFITPLEFNTFEQYEGAINGWQKYNRNEFVKLTNSYDTILSVDRAFYTTRAYKKNFTPKESEEIKFKLTVIRKCSNETKEYTFTDILKLPYPLIEVEE